MYNIKCQINRAFHDFINAKKIKCTPLSLVKTKPLEIINEIPLTLRHSNKRESKARFSSLY